MSAMNCAEAIQAVLDRVETDGLMVIRVENDENSPAAMLSRRVTLPWAEDVQLRFAQGCAQAGMLTVLDLCAVDGAALLLEDAFRSMTREKLKPMIVRLCSRALPTLTEVWVTAPLDALEAAKAMRRALRYDGVSVIVENPLTAYETCDVPEEALSQDAADEEDVEEAAPVDDVTSDETPDAGQPVDVTCEEPQEEDPEETAEETEEASEEESAVAAYDLEEEQPETLPEADEPVEAEQPDGGVTAARCRSYDPSALFDTARRLAMGADELAALCCRRASAMAEIILETDCDAGETAFVPPTDRNACLWVGHDRLTLCWCRSAMETAQSGQLLRETARLLEEPIRLILDLKMS